MPQVMWWCDTCLTVGSFNVERAPVGLIEGFALETKIVHHHDAKNAECPRNKVGPTDARPAIAWEIDE